MELRHLMYFKRVAELENITKAANELFVSQSHLSHVIIDLETELGVPLFDRVGRGIQLTLCGKEFYHDIVNLNNGLEDSKKRVLALHKRQLTQLTVVTNVSTYMPGLLKAIKLSYPNLTIQQYSAKRRTIIRMLLDGSADFAICCPMILEEPDLESLLLRNEAGVVVYPENHWLKDKKTVSFSELIDEDFINVSVGYGTRDGQDMYFKKAGFVPKNSIETNDTPSIFSYVKDGLGIALAPKTITLQNSDFKNQYIEIDEAPSATIGLTWNKNHYISEAGRTFFETAIDYFSALDETRNNA